MHEAILTNVVHPLRTIAQVDVFFVIKLDDDPRPFYPESPRNTEATRLAMQKFNPVLVRELGPEDDMVHTLDAGRYQPVYISRPGGDNKSRNTGTSSGSLKQDDVDDDNGVNDRILSQRLISKPLDGNCTADENVRAFVPHALHRSRQCLTEIRSYEASHSVNYTYLYRIRPDVVFLDAIPMPTLLTSGTVVTNAVPAISTRSMVEWWKKTRNTIPTDTGDHLLAATARDADVAFSAVNAVDDCELFKMPVLKNSEMMLLYWMLTKGLTPITPQTAWVLVREGTGAECERLGMLRLVNGVWGKRMLRKCESFRRKVKAAMALK